MIIAEKLSKEWPQRPLSDVAEFLDHRRRPIKSSDRKPGQYPYYGANGQQGTIDDYIFDEPLVLLAEDGGYFGEPTRPIAYSILGKTWVNNHAHVLRARNELCTTEFLCRVLSFYDARPFITGTTRAKLTKGDAARIPIPIPSLSEQRRIVEILDQADALRKQRAEADAKAARILPALFYKMFGDPVTNPKRWRLKPFDEVLEDCTSKHPKLQRNEYQKTGRFPVVDQGKDLVAGYSDNEELVTIRNQPVIVFGDHTRVVKYVDFPFIAGADGSRVLSAKDGFVPAFLAAQLELQPIPNLGYSRHMRELRRLQFMEPPVTLQEEHERCTAHIRPIIDAQSVRHTRIESIWNALLHNAFTGSLTAKWRETHMKELLVEMERQTKTLNERQES